MSSTFTIDAIRTADPAALAALQSDAFADDEPSSLLAEVLAAEQAARPPDASRDLQDHFGLAAYRDGALTGWTQGFRQGRSEFYMLNSGVRSDARRQGVYSALVEGVLAHARSQGYTKVTSHHRASNAAVLIAKLRLGFQVSGFTYSEVYGPLVQLSFIVSEARRGLYQARAVSIRAAGR